MSDTFHGRDIFAAVAAHLSLGVDPAEMGEPVQEVVSLDVYPPAWDQGSVTGRIVFVDHFGNLVTNIRASLLSGLDVQLRVGGASIEGLRRTFSDAEGILALTGSHGYVEIAERNGSAARSLALDVGAMVTVTITSS